VVQVLELSTGTDKGKFGWSTLNSCPITSCGSCTWTQGLGKWPNPLSAPIRAPILQVNWRRTFGFLLPITCAVTTSGLAWETLNQVISRKGVCPYNVGTSIVPVPYFTSLIPHKAGAISPSKVNKSFQFPSKFPLPLTAFLARSFA